MKYVTFEHIIFNILLSSTMTGLAILEEINKKDPHQYCLRKCEPLMTYLSRTCTYHLKTRVPRTDTK